MERRFYLFGKAQVKCVPMAFSSLFILGSKVKQKLEKIVIFLNSFKQLHFLVKNNKMFYQLFFIIIIIKFIQVIKQKELFCFKKQIN